MSLEQTLSRCSFCGRHGSEVQRLIAGPGAVYICDDCLRLCNAILEEPAFSARALELASRPPVLPVVTLGTRESVAKKQEEPQRTLPLSAEQKQQGMTLALQRLLLYTNRFEVQFYWVRPPLPRGFPFLPRLLFSLEDDQGRRWEGDRGRSLYQIPADASPPRDTDVYYEGSALFSPLFSPASRVLRLRATDPTAAFSFSQVLLWDFRLSLPAGLLQ